MKKGLCFHVKLWLDLVKWSEVKWKSQSCSIFCNPRDYAVQGILQARILEWVAYPFSSGSSRPRNRTGIFGIAGRFFTNWIFREALSPWHCHLILTACATDLVLRGQPSPHTWFSFLPQSGSSLSDIHNKPGAPGHLMLSLRTLLLHTISQPDSSPSYRCRAEALGWGTCEGHIDRTKGDWDKHSHVSGFKAFISFVLI